MRIAVIPEIDAQDELSNLLHRIGFYFAHRRPERVSVGVTPGLRTSVLEDWDRPFGFDSVTTDRLTAMASSVELIAQRSLHGARVWEADVVLLWDRDRIESGGWRQTLNDPPPGASMVGVDLRRDRMEGSHYIQAGFKSSPRVDQLIATARERFAGLVERLGGSQRAYLLGTGPSIDRFAGHAFSDGIVIACNTTVLDDELMDHTKPEIVTFADPIFHFGCSEYAGTFRRELQRQAAQHDFAIVIPIKYYDLFTSLCPNLEPRTIGIPFGGNQPNLRLDVKFAVPPIDNIATLLMLPLACTLARDVALLGFDGRSDSESYFWRHSRRTQLHELLPVVRQVHPSFFETDYDDYYDRHTSNMERYFMAGERLGHRFTALEESFIPGLRRRSEELDESALVRAFSPEARYRLVSLNPDLADKFGHYELYDTAIRQAAAEEGGDVVTLASTAYLSEQPWIVPAFTDKSWSVLREEPEVHLSRFRREFERVYELVAKYAGAVPTAIFMYTGSERHLVEIAEIVTRLGDRIPVLINLFYSHRDFYELEQGEAGPEVGVALTLTRPLRQQAGVHAFADSEELQRLIARHIGETLPLWPMFSVTTFESDTDDSPAASSAIRPLTLYAPGNLQLAKGYDLVSKLSTRLANHRNSHEVTLVARSYFRHGTNGTLRRHSDVLRQNAKVLEGLLSDYEYSEAFRTADVILIPYRISHFKTRTSAVISDAVHLGKPVVATRGTWIGDIVERFDMGVTFEDGDVSDFERAVWQMVHHFDYYKGRAVEASREWDADHHPRLLVDIMRTVIDNAESGPITSVDPAEYSGQARALYDRLRADRGQDQKSSTPPTSSDSAAKTEVRLRKELDQARVQIRSLKRSAAFRLVTKIVTRLKKLGPFYRPIRSMARKIAGETENT